jgi:hypothetical protein
MIDKLIKDILRKIINEINKDENKYIIQNDIFNPLICQIKLCFYPYIILFIIGGFSLFLINLLLIIIILYNKKNI